MRLGRVVGTVVSTQKDEKINGLKLFVVRDLNLDISEKNSFVVAADAVGAGVGEVVLYSSGSAARQTKQTQSRPLDAVIMAIVDLMDVNGDLVYDKYASDVEGGS